MKLKIVESLVDLFYPKLCMACDEQHIHEEKIICSGCELDLPNTDFHMIKDNLVEEHFWGRVPIERATSFLYFTKGGRVQRLTHNLKYANKPEVGVAFGAFHGRALKDSDWIDSIDYIIPVPLHPKKKHIRGYNQSERYAKGLSDVLGIPNKPMFLQRVVFTETQTKKTRLERIENVKDAFQVPQLDELKDKHVLLVDDIITTGATLESAAKTLIEKANAKVSIATIGFAMS